MIPCRTPMCKAHGGMRCLNVTVSYLARRRRRRGVFHSPSQSQYTVADGVMGDAAYWVGVAPV